MAESSKPPVIAQGALEPVPYVVVRRADGKLVLRHPDELQPAPWAAAAPPGPGK